MRAILMRIARTQNPQNGYIALISAVIISGVLMGLAGTANFAGFFSRLNVLNSEYKRESLGLAESCVYSALLKIAQDYLYAPAAGGETISINPNFCKILSVSYGAEETSHRKIAAIVTQGEYRGAFSNIIVTADVLNPTAQTATPTALPNISIVSWEETPTRSPGP